MNIRFRKSVKLGKNLKLNINKNSISVSAGNKLGRVSLNSKGKATTSLRTPIKGLYITDTHSLKKKYKK